MFSNVLWLVLQACVQRTQYSKSTSIAPTTHCTAAAKNLHEPDKHQIITYDNLRRAEKRKIRAWGNSSDMCLRFQISVKLVKFVWFPWNLSELSSEISMTFVRAEAERSTWLWNLSEFCLNIVWNASEIWWGLCEMWQMRVNLVRRMSEISVKFVRFLWNLHESEFVQQFLQGTSIATPRIKAKQRKNRQQPAQNPQRLKNSNNTRKIQKALQPPQNRSKPTATDAKPIQHGFKTNFWLQSNKEPRRWVQSRTYRLRILWPTGDLLLNVNHLPDPRFSSKSQISEHTSLEKPGYLAQG